jgi:hypothetical protein
MGLSLNADVGNLRISPSTKDGKKPFTSDSSCFAPYADAKIAPAPECAKCGRPSVGANFREFYSPYPAGRISGTAEFSCGCDGNGIYAIHSSNISPQWRLVSQIESGVWRIVKRTSEEKAIAVQEHDPAR